MCVSVNLTVVYASVSYSIIKKTDLSGLLVREHDMCTHLPNAECDFTGIYGP